MIHRIFIGIDEVREGIDLKHLENALDSIHSTPHDGRYQKDVVLVIKTRELSPVTYRAIKQGLKVAALAGCSTSVIVPSGFISMDVLCSVAGADSILIEDGVRLSLDIEPDHPAFVEYRDFCRAAMRDNAQPFIRQTSKIVSLVQNHLVDESIDVKFIPDASDKMFDLQICSDEVDIFNPKGSSVVKDFLDLGDSKEKNAENKVYVGLGLAC